MPQPARPKAGPTKDNTTAAQKSSFFGVGLRCACRWPSGVLPRWMLLLLPGYSNTGPTTAAQQKSSFFGVGLRSARLCAFRGLLLRWLLLLCHSRHGRRPGPQKDNNNSSTTKEQLLWGGASLPLAALHGEESRRRPNSRTAEQPNSRTARTARTAEQLPPLTSASPSPVRFRRLPRPEAIYHSAVL